MGRSRGLENPKGNAQKSVMSVSIENRGRRKEEGGKRKEERGKRKEERGKRKEERGKRKVPIMGLNSRIRGKNGSQQITKLTNQQINKFLYLCALKFISYD